MPSSADIGASFHSYQGNAALGGGSAGVIHIDTKPIEQLAQYTFFYHKAEYDQRQKDAEEAAKEIAASTNYDLSTGIEKDSKLLRDKYDKLIEFIKNNPDAINYRDKEKYLEYRKMRSDLDNDVAGAKVRSITYMARVADIQKNTNKQLAAVDLRDLMDEVNSTDIRTPIKVAAQYDIKPPEFKAPPALKFDVYKTGANEDQQRVFSLFNATKARANAFVDVLDLTKSLDPNTPEGERRAIARGQNFYTSGADALNAALQSPLYRDANGNLDESKLKGVSKDMVGLIKQVNAYLENTKTEIKSGVYRDKFKNPITFGSGELKESDYDPINYSDGISPEELSLVAQYAAWQGDSFETKTVKTDDELQKGQLGVSWFNAQTGRINANKKPETTGGETPNTTTTGNSFDEIGGAKEVLIGKKGKGGKISDGYVYDAAGNKFTGDVTISADNLPVNTIEALKASGTELTPTTQVEVTSKDGTIVAIKPKNGNIITRQNIENAQKKFDTEQKGQERTQWGRKLNTTPNKTTDVKTTSSGLPIIHKKSK